MSNCNRLASAAISIANELVRDGHCSAAREILQEAKPFAANAPFHAAVARFNDRCPKRPLSGASRRRRR